MSRQYNPAESAYLRMDLDGFNKLDKVEEPDKSGGLLSRSSMSKQEGKGLDFSNPAARVAKQMQVIRKYRDEINGTK